MSSTISQAKKLKITHSNKASNYIILFMTTLTPSELAVIIYGIYCVVFTMLMTIEYSDIYDEKLRQILGNIYVIDMASFFFMIIIGLNSSFIIIITSFLFAGSVTTSMLMYLNKFGDNYSDTMLYRWAITLPSLTCIISIVMFLFVITLLRLELAQNIITCFFVSV